jgi:hypothetical protein
MVLSSWIFGGDRSALAFSPAEVAFLFPAPLTRRALIGYKLYRAQMAILINALIWVILIRRGGAVPFPVRAISFWLLFTTLNFHRLVAALVRSSIDEHRRHGARRHFLSVVILVAAVGLVLASIAMHADALRAATGFREVLATMGVALGSTPARIALWPFAAILGPTFAPDLSAWAAALPAALLILLLHAWWVLRSDAAFEEAAVSASAERVEMIQALRESRGWRRRRRTVKPRAAPLSLRPTGAPAGAIVWKNLICLRRTLQFQDLIPLLLPGFFAGVAVAVSAGGRSEGFAAAAVFASTMVAVMLFVFGSRIVRNDLRQDMTHIIALKTMPLPGHSIVAAEVASAAVPLAGLQLLLLAIAAVGAPFMRRPVAELGETLTLWLALVPVLISFNIASTTIQNAAPVLFPSWTRLGTGASPGVEALGQNIVTFGLVLVLLVLMLVLPVAVGAGMWIVLPSVGMLGAGVGIALGSALLLLESYVVMRGFGSALERTEPSQLT